MAADEIRPEPLCNPKGSRLLIRVRLVLYLPCTFIRFFGRGVDCLFRGALGGMPAFFRSALRGVGGLFRGVFRGVPTFFRAMFHGMAGVRGSIFSAIPRFFHIVRKGVLRDKGGYAHAKD